MDLEEKKIRNYFTNNSKEEYSHLLEIINDDGYDIESFYRLVKRTEDIKDIIFNIVSYPNYRISKIFSFDLDLEQQLKERKPYNILYKDNLIYKAITLATNKHKNQTRLNGKPYIEHPILVAKLVKTYFKEEENIKELEMAAYLHDPLEDTDTTVEDIKYQFGDYVASLVLGVTNDKILKDEMGKINYLCSKMTDMNEGVLNLKLCDRLANILDLVNAPNDFQNQYLTETTVIIDYLLKNKKLTTKQIKIIEVIATKVNDLRKTKIKKLINNEIK